MSKAYLPYDPDQQLLLPAFLQEWLPDDHLAYFISDVVDQLDLSTPLPTMRGRTRRPAVSSSRPVSQSLLPSFMLHRAD